MQSDSVKALRLEAYEMETWLIQRRDAVIAAGGWTTRDGTVLMMDLQFFGNDLAVAKRWSKVKQARFDSLVKRFEKIQEVINEQAEARQGD